MAINIAVLWQKGKNSLMGAAQSRDASLVIILLGVAVGAFSCGRMSIIEAYAKPVAVKHMALNEISAPISEMKNASTTDKREVASKGAVPASEGSSGKTIVASKNGTKYHLVTCPGAKSIKEENKVWFASEAAAQAAGYTRAGNCK